MSMKKRNLLLGLSLLGALSVHAQSSFTGSEPADGQEFYLYNVETGLWFQGYQAIPGANRDRWNTAANVGSYGRPIKFELQEDGTWKLNPLAGDEILGSRYGDGGLLYLDWRSNEAKWSLTGDVENGYVITAEAIGDDPAATLGVNDDENPLLINNATTNNHWQLVTAAERLEKLAEASADAPQDATWLINNPELMNNDHLAGQWTVTRDGGDDGWRQDFRPNRIFESWEYHSLDFSETLSVPNGKYEVTAYAVFSPTGGGGLSYEDYQDYLNRGEDAVDAYLYANDESVKLPSIYSFTSDTPVPDYASKALEEGGVSIVDGFWQAARAMGEDGQFLSKPVAVTVTDGQLKVGIKDDKDDGNWVIIGSFQLKYLGNDVDVSEYVAALNAAIEKAEAFKGNTTDILQSNLDEALAAAKNTLTSTDPDELSAKTIALNEALAAAKDVDDTVLEKVVAAAKEDGVDVSEGEDVIKNGTAKNQVNNVVAKIRDTRKQAHFETETATFEGNEPFEGDFYLLNVGRKNYLTSGSNWGTHLALGWPGLELTATASGEGYIFHFNELNDQARQRAMTADYVDGEEGWAITYVFEPVDGKPGVYAVKNTSDNSYLGFDPDATPEGTKYFDSVTSFLPNADSEDAQWIIVTKDERLAQVEKATADNPVDVTLLIRDASFNKFATAGDPWNSINQDWEFGNREFGDKNTEHYHGDGDVENLEQFSLTQEIVLPKAGVYELSVQAYFRDGEIDPHVQKVENSEELAPAAVLFANANETPLMYIHEEADKAPGEGQQTAVGEFPNNMIMASKFFEYGLYKNTLTFEVDESEAAGGVIIGIDELENRVAGSWIVADNFRLKYLGDTSGIDGVKEDSKTGSKVAYNLFGQRVAKAQKGEIIIKGGKKYITK